ncbi:MFS transporter [Rosettibacter firmus]|uniref:MFS transporter n=1 Tax=Rosettibacter firmus TaxID=3111522 RepID=UPI00336BF1CC
MSYTKPLDKLNLFDLSSVQMKTFHIVWVTFFTCFFSWFAIAPLMPVIREELKLSKDEIGNIVIASVFATTFARIIIGRVCDSIGPRLTHVMLLIIGAIPVLLVGLSYNYISLLVFRLLIGIIGASIVITQFHTTQMFAPNIVGTANALTAGWGNLGGGVANLIMPIIFTGIISLGFTKFVAWRIAMIIPGILLLLMAYIYYKYTQDTPYGNYKDLKKIRDSKKTGQVKFIEVIKEYKVWLLTLAYAASFGIEITFDNVAAIYFVDYFDANLILAGTLASLFGLMNIFARFLGGFYVDKVGNKYGIKGKWIFLGILLLFEGFGIFLFANTHNLSLAIISMFTFALFLKMANGANYGIVPFINKKATGTISGIVAAGGNVGAILAGFLFKSNSISYKEAFLIIGITVFVIGLIFTVLVMKLLQESKKEIEQSENLVIEPISD